MHPLSRRLIDRAPRGLRSPLSLVVGTVDRSVEHRLPGLAAEIAFWVLLSLPALLLGTIATAGVLGGERAALRVEFIDRITEVARLALTEATISQMLRPLLESLFDEGGIGLVSFAFLATVWTASRAVRVVLATIALTADHEASRPGWKQRLLGFALTLATMLGGIVVAPLMLAGPGFGEQIADPIGADAALATIWRTAYWPTTVAVIVLSLAVLYHLGVPGRTPWRYDLPGAALATVVWLLGSGGLRLYGLWVVDESSAYGPLAGPIVVLLWLWLTGLAVLVGAEFNGMVARRLRHHRRDRSTDHAGTWPRDRPATVDDPSGRR